MESYPMAQARAHLAELVSRARHGHEPVVLTEHGAPVAAIISVDELDELRQARDAADLALCEAIRDRSGPGTPHGKFMALLDAEDSRA